MAMVSEPRSFRIVRATVGQVDLIAPLFDAYRQFYQQSSDPLGAKAFLRDRLEKNESVIFLALEERPDGDPQALGFIQLYPSFSSVGMKHVWILNDLFVVPRARKTGVARALMNHVAEFARGTPAKRIVLQTAHDNFAAQRLYESLGYVKEEGFYTYQLDI